MYESIPNELKQLNQWVCWKALPDETRPGKIKKMPINPYTGGQAQSNNADTWADFNTALTASKSFSGIGFMFASGYFGVDIDGVDSDIEEYQMGNEENIIYEFIHTLQSYSEYSVSGKGLHIICKGKLPKNGRRKKNIEMYESGRFFIMTGNMAAEYCDINECTQSIKPLHEKYIGGGMEPKAAAYTYEPQITLQDDEVIENANKSKQGGIFSDLFAGNWDNYFQSQSEADMSFCNMLAFWCQKDEEQMDRIFRSSGLMREKWDRKQSGTTYGKITLKKAISTCKDTYSSKREVSQYVKFRNNKKKKIYSFDDTGNAERFTDMFADKIRYSYINKNWIYYDGRKWCGDNSGAIKRMADETVEMMRGDLNYYIANIPDNPDIEKQFLKHIKTSRSNKSKTAMIKESEHRAPILPEQVDNHSMLLNTLSGIVDMRTGDLKPHDISKYITKITYSEYTDTMDCPMWVNFLNDIFENDPDMIRYIQKAIGYSLTGSTAEQCMFFCYGTGRNGKSTFLDIVSEMAGDYASNVQPETLMIRSQSGGANSDIARLKGARFVTSVEPNEGAKLNEGLIKQLTGGDRITARHLYGKEFEFYPEFKIWMGTNHKPVIRGTDEGIWRRVHMIPFDVQIPVEKMDRKLKFKLKQELPAILKWAIDGCLLWQREGLKKPKIVEEATNEYRSEMDLIKTFCDECIVIGPGEVKAQELYNVYRSWCEEGGYFKMTGTKFGREMSVKFEKRKSHGVNVYLGIRLNKNGESLLNNSCGYVNFKCN